MYVIINSKHPVLFIKAWKAIDNPLKVIITFIYALI